MKQRLFIILGVFILGAILIGLNAASYTQKPKVVDNELQPNRSTFNSGPTGTQAFYSLLSETGRKVVRWQESTEALLTARDRKPDVFVIIGRIRRDITDAESKYLLKWVSGGGRLVLIDRAPPTELLTTSADWTIELSIPNYGKLLSVDATDSTALIKDVAAARPGQPTLLTAKVNSIQPSIFTSDVTFRRMTEQESKDRGTPNDDDVATPDNGENREVGEAPVSHFVSGNKNIVVDVPYGSGRIVFVSDPFIVSNAGISLVDNAQLAINLVATRDGIVAFDEFHHGFGSNNNRFVEYFAGTPVVAIFFQCLVLVGFIFYSKSRRFGRSVPEFEADRLSKLEYVSAMAEMQRRTRSFDLAIENIYRDFRRRASRLLGLDNHAVTTNALSIAIAERTGIDQHIVEKTLDDCEQIIFGEPTNKSEVLVLAKHIREFEDALGMRRRIKG
ncbi:MAG: DUF4350 domain-containing protein [Acidobacteria bacterium]|nr:DUF4350 domain-containing protein [Acidobacteriota bacterium]MBK7932191.1 DUF4350 domain-containing protein [Acidobacteriota bacterium]